MKDSISIIVPAFNEEGNIDELYRRLSRAITASPVKSAEIIFVDDGSTDGTLSKCKALLKTDRRVRIVRLVKNQGHEIAMVAGMDSAKGEGLIFIDADLQNPPELIPEMVKLWREGKDIVLTHRSEYATASWPYRQSSKIFYGVLNFLSDVHVPHNMPDFRLIDRKYVKYLKQFDERDFLFRGVLSLVASLDDDNVATLEFAMQERYSGKTKYSLWKVSKLAANSILQFSTKPLYLSLWLAIIAGFLAVGLGIYVIIERFVQANPLPGHATVVTAVVFMGALNLFILAIIGAYIAKIHVETKKRPLYIADIIESGPKKRVKKP